MEEIKDRLQEAMEIIEGSGINISHVTGKMRKVIRDSIDKADPIDLAFRLLEFYKTSVDKEATKEKKMQHSVEMFQIYISGKISKELVERMLEQNLVLPPQNPGNTPENP